MFASYSPEEIADLIKKTQEAYMKLQFNASINSVSNSFRTPIFGMPSDWFGVDWGIKNACDHTFKDYVGFNESYKYCTKCDLKKT